MSVASMKMLQYAVVFKTPKMFQYFLLTPFNDINLTTPMTTADKFFIFRQNHLQICCSFSDVVVSRITPYWRTGT